ncbi:hypothetical protein BH11PSE5_BH11PSE5_21540 [soil metagenome]
MRSQRCQFRQEDGSSPVNYAAGALMWCSTALSSEFFGAGVTVGGIVLAVIVVVAVLFATGFWSANVQGGELPKVNVSTKGGALPSVDVKSKEVVVGASKTTVDVPTVKTDKKSVDVPTIGVKDNGNK